MDEDLAKAAGRDPCGATATQWKETGTTNACERVWR